MTFAMIWKRLSFVVAPLLVLIFAITLRWLPAEVGMVGKFSNKRYRRWLHYRSLTLQVISRITRSSAIEVLHCNLYRTAKAKGFANETHSATS